MSERVLTVNIPVTVLEDDRELEFELEEIHVETPNGAPNRKFKGSCGSLARIETKTSFNGLLETNGSLNGHDSRSQLLLESNGSINGKRDVNGVLYNGARRNTVASLNSNGSVAQDGWRGRTAMLTLSRRMLERNAHLARRRRSSIFIALVSFSYSSISKCLF